MGLAVCHGVEQALELEFYVPSAVWNHPATSAFLSEIYELVEGATVLGGAKGVWRGQTESTNLVRVLVRERDANFSEAAPSIQAAIERLMQTWAADTKTQQESFLFTVRRLDIYMVSLNGGRTDAHRPTEKQLDLAVENTFPASDPPALSIGDNPVDREK